MYYNLLFIQQLSTASISCNSRIEETIAFSETSCTLQQLEENDYFDDIDSLHKHILNEIEMLEGQFIQYGGEYNKEYLDQEAVREISKAVQIINLPEQPDIILNEQEDFISGITTRRSLVEKHQNRLSKTFLRLRNKFTKSAQDLIIARHLKTNNRHEEILVVRKIHEDYKRCLKLAMLFYQEASHIKLHMDELRKSIDEHSRSIIGNMREDNNPNNLVEAPVNVIGANQEVQPATPVAVEEPMADEDLIAEEEPIIEGGALQGGARLPEDYRMPTYQDQLLQQMNGLHSEDGYSYLSSQYDPTPQSNTTPQFSPVSQYNQAFQTNPVPYFNTMTQYNPMTQYNSVPSFNTMTPYNPMPQNFAPFQGYQMPGNSILPVEEPIPFDQLGIPQEDYRNVAGPSGLQMADMSNLPNLGDDITDYLNYIDNNEIEYQNCNSLTPEDLQYIDTSLQMEDDAKDLEKYNEEIETNKVLEGEIEHYAHEVKVYQYLSKPGENKSRVPPLDRIRVFKNLTNRLNTSNLRGGN